VGGLMLIQDCWRLIALDDICVKVNGLVGFMLDVDRNEIYEGLSSKYSYY
jgi:hypothetical protein